MVEKHFIKALEDLNLTVKINEAIKTATSQTLDKLLYRLKTDLLKGKKNYSRKSSLYGEELEINENFREEEHEKNIEHLIANKLFLAKLARDRQERERKRYEREEKARKKMQEEYEIEEKRRIEDAQIKELEKKRRVEELLKKKETRKKQMDFFKELGDKEYKEVITTKPLYIKFEENYEEQVLMPELEKKKAELARKREFLQPIRRNEIMDHMKKYQEIAYENQARRELSAKNKQIEFKYNNSTGIIKSRFTDNILEEERRKKEELDKLDAEKKLLVEKKKRYASLVKEMFAPSVDEFKRQEMVLIQEKLKHPVRLKIMENRSASDEDKPKKRWKKNNLIPEPPPKREGKIVDYLAEKRKERGNSVEIHSRHINWENILNDSSIDNSEKIKKLKKKAHLLEVEASRFEHNLKSKNSTDHNSLILAHESDSLILNSIKAKLAILESNI